MPTPDCRWARKGLPQPPLAALPPRRSGDEIAIAVVGAHLSGMALNGELTALGGRLLEETADRAGLQALCARHHAAEARHAARRGRRGLVDRARTLGAVGRGFGQFVAAIPPPLSIGTVRLADGRGVKGFLVEPAAIDGARDISAFGGWRAFMAEKCGVSRHSGAARARRSEAPSQRA